MISIVSATTKIPNQYKYLLFLDKETKQVGENQTHQKEKHHIRYHLRSNFQANKVRVKVKECRGLLSKDLKPKSKKKKKYVNPTKNIFAFSAIKTYYMSLYLA